MVFQAAVPVGIDDVRGGGHARGVLTACGGGTGSDFQRRPLAETVRSPAWALVGQAWGVMVDRSNAAVGVRKEAAVCAIGPGRC